MPRSLRLEACVVDLHTGNLSNGRDGRLTTRELQLLEHLALQPSTTVARADLFALFGYAPTARSRAIDKAMSSLRAKIEVDPAAPHHLVTVHGQGYVFHPLPTQTTPTGAEAGGNEFVGRTTELAALRARIEAPGLVTLAGPGGVGKTRLAAQVVADADRVVMVCALATARTEIDVLRIVGAAVDLPAADTADAVAAGIAARPRPLVVLDNVEHLLDQASLIQTWCRLAPQATFLVTSRRPLQLPEESVMRLDPLDPEASIALLRARASEAGHPVLVPSGLDTLATSLDHLPLALELAAGRLDVFTPAQLAAALPERSTVLTNRDRAAPDRFATPTAMLRWSWDLLRPHEQILLVQLTVFAGGFTIEAVEAVSSTQGDGGRFIDGLGELLRSSLVQRRSTGETQRFALLSLVHQFAEAQRSALPPGLWEATAARHGSFYAHDLPVALGFPVRRRPGSHPAPPPQPPNRKRLIVELDNLIAACRRAVDREDIAVAVGALEALWHVIEPRGPFAAALPLTQAILALPGLSTSDIARIQGVRGTALHLVGRGEVGMEALTIALAAADRSGDTELQGAAEYRLGVALGRNGRSEDALPHLNAALALSRERGDRIAEARALGYLGILHGQNSQSEVALGYYEGALSILREIGDRFREGNVLGNLGVFHYRHGRIPQARAHLEQALAISREEKNRRYEGTLLGNLGILYHEQGDADAAEDHLQRALTVHREVGNRSMEGMVLGNLSLVHGGQGRIVEALSFLERALAVQREVGNRREEGIVLGNLGARLYDLGQLDRARDHFDAALVVAREIGHRRHEGMVLANRGMLHLQSDRVDLGRADLQAALGIHREVGNQRSATIVQINLGILSQKLGDPRGARIHFDNALKGARQLADPSLEALCLTRLASLLGSTGDLDEAQAQLDHGETLLRQHRFPARMAQLLAVRAEIRWREGDEAGAAKALTEAEAIAPAAHMDALSAIAEARSLITGATEDTPPPRDHTDLSGAP